MRKPIIAGNWKMYKTPSEATLLARQIKETLEPATFSKKEVVLCPPAVNLAAVGTVIRESGLDLGAQNFYPEAEGAYTGEISPLMLKDIGVKFVIIGHSERRQYFQESDQFINSKVLSAVKHRLSPILCIGETLVERDAGITEKVLEKQLGGGLNNLAPEETQRLVIAYEPVWAIGTGKTATTEQAQTAHAFIRGFLANRFNSEIAERIRLQYGGSVKPDNAESLMTQPDIDGALVGGASLTSEAFAAIIRAAAA